MSYTSFNSRTAIIFDDANINGRKCKKGIRSHYHVATFMSKVTARVANVTCCISLMWFSLFKSKTCVCVSRPIPKTLPIYHCLCFLFKCHCVHTENINGMYTIANKTTPLSKHESQSKMHATIRAGESFVDNMIKRQEC